mmetsp:Transcript_45204/g.96560  ORF Transcript_45204/g.96560 Transcript_45204/m.96560 type:complete len:279 (+) Transcript_45204:117-953(+)
MQTLSVAITSAHCLALPRGMGPPDPPSLAQEPACVVLLLHLIRGHPTLLPDPNVLGEPRLAVICLNPGSAALLIEWVIGRPRGEAAQETFAQARRLILVGGGPALVPVPFLPIVVLLNLGRVADAFRNDLPLQIAQRFVVAATAKCLTQLDLHRPELEHQIVDLRAGPVLLQGRPHPVPKALRALRFLEAFLTDKVAILCLQETSAIFLLNHPIKAVAVHPGRRPACAGCGIASEGAQRCDVPRRKGDCTRYCHPADPGAASLKGHGATLRGAITKVN